MLCVMLLTRKQQLVLDKARAYYHAHKVWPSYRQLAALLGLRSPATIHQHVEVLKIKGVWHLEQQGIPFLGRISAGVPLEPLEVPERLEVPSWMMHHVPGEYYVLEVSGDSMYEAGILDKDRVLIRKQIHAFRGQIVVACVDGEVTLKYWYPHKDGVELRPANSLYPSIQCLKDQDVSIKGVFAGLLRWTDGT
jgi:repressor LexA